MMGLLGSLCLSLIVIWKLQTNPTPTGSNGKLPIVLLCRDSTAHEFCPCIDTTNTPHASIMEWLRHLTGILHFVEYSATPFLCWDMKSNIRTVAFSCNFCETLLETGARLCSRALAYARAVVSRKRNKSLWKTRCIAVHGAEDNQQKVCSLKS